MIKKNNFIIALLLIGLLSPQISTCSENSTGWGAYFKSFFSSAPSAVSKALSSYASKGTAQLSQWATSLINSLGENQKIVLFTALAALFGFVVYKNSNGKIEKVEKKSKPTSLDDTSAVSKEPLNQPIPQNIPPSTEPTITVTVPTIQTPAKPIVPENPVPQAPPLIQPAKNASSSSSSEEQQLITLKTYPVELYNAYDVKIAYNTSEDCNNEKRNKYLAPNASINFNATVSSNGKVIIKDLEENPVESLCVRSSGPGSGYGLRQATYFNDFQSWKDKINYESNHGDKTPSSFQIKIAPISKSLSQLSPGTPFEAKLNINYEK